MGPGAQVREGCLLEEEANGAHCVGLKQTILFPFVTLGSLINFCDCLMAGGTSRKDHSEVGSSYIHFNFTPDGDKTTASLFGDVPRGVMLDQPPIFLGGQGGAVGPVRAGLRDGGGGGLGPAATTCPTTAGSSSRRRVPARERDLRPARLQEPGPRGGQQHRLPGEPGGARAVVPPRPAAVLRRAGAGRPGLRGRARHAGAGQSGAHEAPHGDGREGLRRPTPAEQELQGAHRRGLRAVRGGGARRPARRLPGGIPGGDRRRRRQAGRLPLHATIQALPADVAAMGVEWLQRIVDTPVRAGPGLLSAAPCTSPATSDRFTDREDKHGQVVRHRRHQGRGQPLPHGRRHGLRRRAGGHPRPEEGRTTPPASIIGKDTRISGYMLESALESGITSMGGDALAGGRAAHPGHRLHDREHARRRRASSSPPRTTPTRTTASRSSRARASSSPTSRRRRSRSSSSAGKLPDMVPPPHDMGRAYRLDDAHGRYIVFLKNTFPREPVAGGHEDRHGRGQRRHLQGGPGRLHRAGRRRSPSSTTSPTA